MKPSDPKNSISREFKQLLEKMRAPASVNAALALFKATPEELGKSAAEMARKSDLKQK